MKADFVVINSTLLIGIKIIELKKCYAFLTANILYIFVVHDDICRNSNAKMLIDLWKVLKSACRSSKIDLSLNIIFIEIEIFHS